RSEFSQNERSGRPHRLPGRETPCPDELAEDLAHLRRGDEIAAATERFAPHVIAIVGITEAGGHIVGDRDRPVRADASSEPFAEWRHSWAAIAAGMRRDAHNMTPTPAMIIGMERSIPMVRPPAR